MIIEIASKMDLLAGVVMMIIGAIVEVWLGVDAERKSLEHVATPLSSRET